MVRIKFTRKHLIILVGTLLTVCLVVLILHSRSNKYIPLIPSTSPSQEQTGNSAQINNSASNNSSPTPNQTQKTPAATPSAGGELTLDEAQTFVSNHNPGQNGSGTGEQSVCNTTPGAACYIQFTNGNTTKQLESRVADNSGSVIWSWDTEQAGLTSGSWKITAVAELNGQTKTVQDQRRLIIQ